MKDRYNIQLENKNNPSRIVSEYCHNSKDKVWFRCNEGHEFEAIPNNIVSKNRGCPICNKEKNTPTRDRVNKKLEHKNLKMMEEFKSAREKHIFLCHCGRTWNT